MATSAEIVRRVTASAKGSISREDSERILEIACLAVVADGHVAPEEVVVLEIAGNDIGGWRPEEIAALVRKVSDLGLRDRQIERLRLVGESLTTEDARHLAYKVSVLTALADLASADQEFEFDFDVQDALHLSVADADRLTGEVHLAAGKTD